MEEQVLARVVWEVRLARVETGAVAGVVAGVVRSAVMTCCMAGFFRCGRKKPGTYPSMDVRGSSGRGLGKGRKGRRHVRPDRIGGVRARSTRIGVHGGTPF